MSATSSRRPGAAQATVQIVPPVAVTSFTAVSPNPRNTAVSTVNVTFTRAINTASLARVALTLTDNGGSDLITGAVSVSLVSGSTSTYAINGLAGLTTARASTRSRSTPPTSRISTATRARARCRPPG